MAASVIGVVIISLFPPMVAMLSSPLIGVRDIDYLSIYFPILILGSAARSAKLMVWMAQLKYYLGLTSLLRKDTFATSNLSELCTTMLSISGFSNTNLFETIF